MRFSSQHKLNIIGHFPKKCYLLRVGKKCSFTTSQNILTNVYEIFNLSMKLLLKSFFFTVYYTTNTSLIFGAKYWASMVPQGSKIAPLLYVILINHLPGCVTNSLTSRSLKWREHQKVQ